MIDQYEALDDFEDLVKETRKKREEANAAVIKFGVDILNGDAEYGVLYFNTVLDFMTAENDHIKNVLDLLKCCYENFKTLKYSAAATLEKMREFDDLIEQTRVAFNNFYDVHHKLKDNENDLRNFILKETDNMNKNSLAVMKNIINLRNYNAIHDSYHLELKYQVDTVVNPLIETCESIYQHSAVQEIEFGTNDSIEDSLEDEPLS